MNTRQPSRQAETIESERARADRYAADWRKVCNALNTSPDSSVDVVLAKIATLQKSFHQINHGVSSQH